MSRKKSLQSTNLNSHYNTHDPLEYRFHFEYFDIGFDQTLLYPFLSKHQPIINHIEHDHYHRCILTRSRSSSQYDCIVLRIYENLSQILLTEQEEDQERYNLKNLG